MRYSCALLADLPDRFWDGQAWVMTVSDANRVPVFTLKFLVEPRREARERDR